MRFLRRILLISYRLFYRLLIRPLLFSLALPQEIHEKLLALLVRLDSKNGLQSVLRTFHTITCPRLSNQVGGVILDSPLILAAGFVKGRGFSSEEAACRAVERGENIIPGWRTIPSGIGPVEIGSFTRHPRLGNSGTVMWRDVSTRSTQNRIGLKNPGARAAALFFSKHGFPPQSGINIAISPGVSDRQQEEQEMLEALGFFLEMGVLPAWFTLNLSCPNTEDDPSGNQTEDKTRQLCAAFVGELQSVNVPAWVKISPDLSNRQYCKVLHVLEDVGVRAVVATNTIAQPVPADTEALVAGVGGGRLHDCALRVTKLLMEEKRQRDYAIDIIACGGILDYQSFRAYKDIGIQMMQYWSALVYEGPYAAALILAKES